MSREKKSRRMIFYIKKLVSNNVETDKIGNTRVPIEATKNHLHSLPQ
jgi:hypothetical protein